MVKKNGLEKNITCDSVGTISTHEGNSPDKRMQEAARKRGIVTSGRARMVTHQDFVDADLMLTMDHFNLSEIRRLMPQGKIDCVIRPFCDFVSGEWEEVPDPYYGGTSGFEKVLDLLEDGCLQLFESIK